ncbi:MAG: YedE family putative selenium transporter [Lachnospirales bacterium]
MKLEREQQLIVAGVVLGLAALLLTFMGNPANMGFCIACFLRDTSGSLGFHSAVKVQYIRPEIIGLVLGAFLISFAKKDFKVRGGSSPVQRFFLSIFMMIGALVFLGCPVRMLLRIGGGDLNAIIGLVGFAVGIFIGIKFLEKGFSLKRQYTLSTAEGAVFPAVTFGLLLLLLFAPSFIKFSTEGPGAMHAPWLISLVGGLIVGAVCQRTRFCTAGGIRDTIMFKKVGYGAGLIAVVVTVIIGNIVLKSFNLGFEGQPIAHTDGLGNFLGMVLVGWGAVLLGGCPLRQVALSGEGNVDSVVVILGLLVGAGIAHNFGLASSGQRVTTNGMIAVAIGLIFTLIVSFGNLYSTEE